MDYILIMEFMQTSNRSMEYQIRDRKLYLQNRITRQIKTGFKNNENDKLQFQPMQYSRKNERENRPTKILKEGASKFYTPNSPCINI